MLPIFDGGLHEMSFQIFFCLFIFKNDGCVNGEKKQFNLSGAIFM